MNEFKDIFTFTINGKNYGIIGENIERAIRAVEITALPNAPSIILGIINFHGIIVPVINIRERFNLPPKKISVSDQFVILRKDSKTFAIVVDGISYYLINQKIVEDDSIGNCVDYIQGVVKLNDDLF